MNEGEGGLTGVVRVGASEEPVEDVVVSLNSRHLVSDTRLLQKV